MTADAVLDFLRESEIEDWFYGCWNVLRGMDGGLRDFTFEMRFLVLLKLYSTATTYKFSRIIFNGIYLSGNLRENLRSKSRYAAAVLVKKLID